MKQNWKNISYKVLGLALIAYILLHGLTTTLPELGALQQSSRILFYHVPMWMVVIVMMGISVAQSVAYLRMTDPDYVSKGNPLVADTKAQEAASVGVLFSILGLVSGSIWGRVSWWEHRPDSDLSVWWTNDPILICALIALLIYLAYFLLRASFSEADQRARVAAAYNIFAFAALIPLYFIIPKMLPGLHPTAEGSDAGGGSFIFKSDGIDNRYRLILYPAILAFTLVGFWIYELKSRLSLLTLRWEDYQSEQAYNASQAK